MRTLRGLTILGKGEPMSAFQNRLQQEQHPILLDGATGSELNRRGINTPLPLWSAAALIEAPQVVEAVHADYVAAGAEILTANTFRTHHRNLAAGGRGDQAASLTTLAVQLAKNAAQHASHEVWIAGSQAPLEDCYHPERTPHDAALAEEHEAHAQHLAAAGVDLILVETQPTVREAVAATTAAVQTNLPVLVSLVCGLDGRLLSGETLATAAAALLPLKPAALLVNCCPAFYVAGMLKELSQHAPGVPLGAYANIGEPDAAQGWRNTTAENVETYADLAQDWRLHGAQLIGGCCGTTPRHIAALARLR